MKLGLMGDPKQITSLGGLQAPARTAQATGADAKVNAGFEHPATNHGQTGGKTDEFTSQNGRKPSRISKKLLIRGGIGVAIALVGTAIALGSNFPPPPPLTSSSAENTSEARPTAGTSTSTESASKARPTVRTSTSTESASEAPPLSPPMSTPAGPTSPAPPPRTCANKERPGLSDDECELLTTATEPRLVDRIHALPPLTFLRRATVLAAPPHPTAASPPRKTQLSSSPYSATHPQANSTLNSSQPFTANAPRLADMGQS
jgi:cytoskeletal protein RodZ